MRATRLPATGRSFTLKRAHTILMDLAGAPDRPAMQVPGLLRIWRTARKMLQPRAELDDPSLQQETAMWLLILLIVF